MMRTAGKITIPETRRPVSRQALALMLVLLLAACTTSRIDVARHVSADLSGDTGIVLLARKKDGGQNTEEDFMACLNKALAKMQLQVRIYPEQDFLDKLFPWFESRTAPETPGELPALLSRPGVRERISEIGVRYIAWVDGSSEKVDGGGGMSCAVGPGGGGCFGFVWWDTASVYEASIWDLQKARSVGAVSADASGMSYVPALLVPVPLIARTQHAACKGVAEQLREFFGENRAL
jgi:hypothetical protein